MTLMPWRVRNLISERFPLLYHLAANMGLKSNSEEHWDARLADTWDASHWQWPTKNALVAGLTRPTDVILDIGCGNGGLLRHLRGLGYASLHGLEISGYAIRRLRSVGITMHKGKLPDVPLPDQFFDVVIASQVLEHVIRRRRFLKEIHRVLKPGGRAYIFVPDDCLGPISEPEHVIKYNKESLRTFLGTRLRVVALDSIRDTNHEMAILFAQLEKPTTP